LTRDLPISRQMNGDQKMSRAPMRLIVSNSLFRFRFAAALAVAVVCAAPVQAQDAQALSQRLERLERDIQTLSKMVVRGPGSVPAAEVPGAAASEPALPQTAVARIGVRLDTMENELRDVTGRIEELTYKMEQLNARVDRLVADVDFRLSGLEGKPVGQAPAAASGMQASPTNAPTTEGRMIGRPAGSLGKIEADLVEPAKAQPQPGPGGTVAVQSAPVQGAPVQAPAAQAAPSPATVSRAQAPAQIASTPQPTGPLLPEGTAEDQYQFAFSLLRKHQYDQAEVAFKEFLAKHDGGTLSGNARYWLGETHYARAEYVKAAEVFLQGFEKDSKGSKAPDSLLKLAMSLGQLGQTKEACAAIDKLFADFPNANSSLKRTATRQQRQMNCKQ